MKQNNIRNFAIVAHIDHGKSTLADRLLEATGTVSDRDAKAQFLDSNPIERERGITIKLAPVRMKYFSQLSSSKYILNLIDTPGHVDFSYEVSRSLAACEGIVLVVDSTQGVQAQTLAHMQQVQARKLPVIPVINKIDLPQADVDGVKEQLHTIFGFANSDFIGISAKTGENISAVLDALVARIPPPKGESTKPLRGLIFSSQYDSHRGVVIYVRIIDGSLKDNPNPEHTLKFLASKAQFHRIEIGYFTPELRKCKQLLSGEIGYIATGLKDTSLARVGDTVTVLNEASTQPLPGYQEPKPMVFVELFPIESHEHTQLRDALEKLNLSDSAFTYSPSSSKALGHGFHCGFLGLLHAEVVLERLEREFDIAALTTIPSVEYKVTLTNDTVLTVQKAEDLPDSSHIKTIEEPVMMVTIFVPKDYIGNVMQLTEDKRGQLHDMEYLNNQVKLTYTVPLSEMIVDFFDRLKGATQGYASLDYEYFEHSAVDAVKLSILINRADVDALATLVVRSQAESIGRVICERLKKAIPRQNFEVPIQASIGGKIIARETIKAYRKDVTAKLYGGDRSRKDKLLKKQKKGKKKMKMIGQVEIPQSAFLAVLKS